METVTDPRLDDLKRAVVGGRVDGALECLNALFASPDGAGLADAAGGVLVACYGDFHSAAAVESVFAKLAGASVGPLARVRSLLQLDVEATFSWRRRLGGLANERLGNSLVEAMKATNMPLVTRCLQGLVETAHNDEERVLRARQAGSLLGGLLSERERSQAYVRTVVSAPQRYGLSPQEAMALFEEYTRSAASAYSRTAATAASTRVELTQAVVELGRSLPSRMELRDPTEAQNATFERQVRAVLRCAICTKERAMLPDVLMMLSDFAPRTVSTSGALAGVEQRLWMSLGRTARMTVTSVMASIGKNPVLSKVFTEYATEHASEGTRLGRSSVEVLGVLMLVSAEPFLIRCLQAKNSKVRVEAAYALGALSGPKGLDALLAFLRELMGLKVLDVDNKRLAFSIIESIGRTLRALSVQMRNQLTVRMLQTVPMSETDFKVGILLNFFWVKLDGVDPKLREWATTQATQMLWLPDQAQLAQRGLRTPLGWRQPLVDMLIRLMPFCATKFVETSMQNLGRYCGAYLAVAETCGRAVRPEQVPLLQQMIVQMGLQSDEHHGAQDVYKQESVYDPSSETMVPLTRDSVMVSVIYAVNQQQGEEGEELLAEIYQLAQSKRLPMPGKESASILMEAQMRVLKRKGANTRDAHEAVGLADVASVGRWLDDLDAKYWLKGSRRKARVQALAGLAGAGERRAIPRMIDLLSDKDNVIAGAALTALIDMLKALRKDDEAMEDFSDKLLRELGVTLDNAGRDRIAGLLAKMKPAQEPLRNKIELVMQHGKTSQQVKLALGRTVLPIIDAADKLAREAALTEGDSPDTLSDSSAGNESIGAGGNSVSGGSAKDAYRKFLPNRGTGGRSAEPTVLDKKRAYIMARQEWIRGGKRGPEPQMPE